MTDIYMFTGVETQDWVWADFDKCIAFCKAHDVNGIEVKIYELTQGEWYPKLGGPSAVVAYLEKAGMKVMPYGFFYGTDKVVENNFILKYLNEFGRFCANMETDWNNNNNGAIDWLVATLGHKPKPSEFWVSTWADPATQQWLDNIAKIQSFVDVWQPEEYSDNLIQMRLNEFPKVSGDIRPTYCVGQVDVNNILIQDELSIWEYSIAVNHTDWLDQFVKHVRGTVMNWYDYDICVPFGNTNFDAALGGAHDLDTAAPPNSPVTAVLAGTVSSVSAPKWGWSVGIKLDTPYNGHDYCAHLHLSAVNPKLHGGDHVQVGDLIGWVGGGTNDAMYNGTTNPTGDNFLNDTFNSSRIQCGFALMDGPIYGTIGWKNFPPIDWTLDPTPIIMNARKNSTPVVAAPPDGHVKQANDMWDTNTISAPKLGIFNKVYLPLYKRINLQTPTSLERKSVDWANKSVLIQTFSSGYYVVWYPTGEARVYDCFNKLQETFK